MLSSDVFQHLGDVLQDQRLIAGHTEATLSRKWKNVRALKEKKAEMTLLCFQNHTKKKQKEEFIRKMKLMTEQKLIILYYMELL